MSSAVKLSKSIVSDAKIISKALNRSVAGQIEHWAKIGRLAEENPDLTYSFIKDILIAQQEVYESVKNGLFYAWTHTIQVQLLLNKIVLCLILLKIMGVMNVLCGNPV